MEKINNPKVSVIIATYNSSHTLQYTLKSLLNQTFQDFEAWIIGDCCTDNTEQLITSLNDPRLHWHNRTTNSGSQPAPNNEGLKRAKGAFIAYLGHDDLWFPNHLEELLSHAEKHQLEFTYAITILVSPDGINQVRGKPFIGSSIDDFVPPPSSWLHKKELIKQVGLWEEGYLSLTTNPDIEFFSRSLSLLNKVNALKILTVIKFHSEQWRSYKNKEVLTAEIEKYWIRISANPDHLVQELLNDMVNELSAFNLTGMILPPKICLRMIRYHYTKRLRDYLIRIAFFRILFYKRHHKNYLSSRSKALKQRGLV